MTSGFFITLEGPEGGGKSTQASRLAKYLRERGRNVLLTREPGGTLLGEQIRALLNDFHQTDLHPRAEILLFCASRAQLVYQIIQPHLEDGGTVVCDRFSDSTLAYQGYGRGLDLDSLRTIIRFATGACTPHLSLLLDLPVEVGLERRKQSGGEWNRMDAQTLEFHQRVRQGYKELACAEPARWVRIDASGNADQVWDEIRIALDRILSARAGQQTP
jgi:dTMP kinase